MAGESRFDSATALVRSPLFAHLGRLDLARLAGELEELRFESGQAVVREGDAADGFYVIKDGRVVVVTGVDRGAEERLTTLGTGDTFGEIALLTGEPRTATVVAETNLTVWRLSRARFDALLGRERGIARSVERALSQRLGATTHETGAFRALAHALVRSRLDALSPPARRLLPALVARRSWPEGALARTAARTATEAPLQELMALSGLGQRRAGQLHLDPAFASLVREAAHPPEREWLLVAAEELAADGDQAGALDLELLVGAHDRAARRAAGARARLEGAFTIGDVDRWLGVLGSDAPAAAGLAALRARLTRARTDDGRTSASRAPRPGALTRLAAFVTTRGSLGAGAAVLAYALGWLLPLPAGLSRPGLVALGGVIATVPLLVWDVVPDYVVMLLLTIALVVPGVVSAADILGGFAAPAWIMILALLAVGTAVARSGLMFRLVLLSLERLPSGFITQSLVLCGAGVVMTAGLTSGSTRIALGVPIARGMADAMGFGRQSPGAAAIGLLTFFAFLEVGELFLTGTFTGLVVHDLLPGTARASITWLRWFLVALPPFAVIETLTYLTILFMFRPQRSARVNLDSVRLQRALLGPLTRDEIGSAVVLTLLVIGFMTRDLHGIAAAWLAVGAFLALFVIGALDDSALQSGGGLGLLVYSGVTLSLGAVFSTLHIDTWLTAVVQAQLPAMVRNPYGFVLVIAVLAFVLHFFVPYMTASTVLALVAMPVAQGLGFHPFIPVLVALIAGDHTFVGYVNSGYPMTYFASEGELFSHAQARWPLILESLYRIVGPLASVPVWQLMGMM
jgi:CRP-like cAMP-binding protein/di/tricarboxylate transporter